ncbi:MAG TPA: DinB family protein [Natronosporangium sp.]
MPDTNDPKAVLKRYLQEQRDALVWKIDGLDERAARWPRTPTGTSLLGILKHCVNLEVGYFGRTFGRQWPTPEELVPDSAFDDDPQADWYATEHETRDGLVDLYRRVWTFADETIDSLPLDAPGRVPWWPGERGEVTLHRVLVHVATELARHAGHADILRELTDELAGLIPGLDNIPEYDWEGYIAKLKAIAERF